MDELKVKYAKLLKGITLECGDGWHIILDNLLAIVEYRNSKAAESGDDFVKIIQIKEKFGGLRFYYRGGDDHLAGAVQMAEYMSEKTCDVCGCPGKKFTGGWIKVRCDAHEKL